MPMPERAQYLDLEVRLSEPSDDGTFEGLASVFGEVDAYGDTVERGAFRKSLAEHRKAGRLPPMLWMHRQDEPVGKWLDLKETATGLQVRGKLSLATARGAEAYAMLKDAVIDGLSIGFRAIKSARTKTGRILQEISLAEVSLVALPALASARVTSVKGLPMPDIHDDDGAVETASHDLPPEMLERIEAVETKAGAVDEIATRLDRIETRLARPSARVEVREDDAALERKAFNSFLRKGWDGLPELEKRVLATIGGSPDSGGAHLVPEQFVAEIIKNLVLLSPLRTVARVMNVSGSPVLLPKRAGTLAAGWVAELVQDDLTEPLYTQQSVNIYEMRATAEISNALLEDAAFNMAGELARDFAEQFAYTENLAFVSGSGSGQPEGFLNASDFVVRSDAFDADAVIDLFHSVATPYANNGTWLMNRATMGQIRKFRSAVDGPYIWADSLVPGNPPTLMNRPVLEIPALSNAGVGSPPSVSVAFGDWGEAYRVLDRTGVELLRDPFSAARYSIVQFHARRRVGGALVKPEAVIGLSA